MKDERLMIIEKNKDIQQTVLLWFILKLATILFFEFHVAKL